MKFIRNIFILLLLIIVVLESWYIVKNNNFFKNSSKKNIVTPKPLLAYTFDNLRKTKFPQTQITLGPVVSKNSDFISQIFYFSVPKKPNSKILERVSGLMNIPLKPGNYPVIVMFRGFVPSNIYKPGIGTQPVAAVLASHGYITLAPDFLGFGSSASSSADSFEDRFQTYTTALTLLSSLPTLNSGLSPDYKGEVTADLSKIGIWGHSNGGHIALSTLAISGVTFPTVLWAPVSVSFPYSILYYTDESDDQGMALRKALAKFETIYNTNLFSPPNYYKWIKAPIEVNQGTNDVEVPIWWSNNLVLTLKKNGLDVKYYTYSNSDHNMLPDGWSKAVLNTLAFYNSFFK